MPGTLGCSGNTEANDTRLTPGRASVLGPDMEEGPGRGVCPSPEHKKVLPEFLLWRPNLGMRRDDTIEEEERKGRTSTMTLRWKGAGVDLEGLRGAGGGKDEEGGMGQAGGPWADTAWVFPELGSPVGVISAKLRCDPICIKEKKQISLAAWRRFQKGRGGNFGGDVDMDGSGGEEWTDLRGPGKWMRPGERESHVAGFYPLLRRQTLEKQQLAASKLRGGMLAEKMSFLVTGV